MASDKEAELASLVADRVRDLRVSVGLNQTEFARSLGASRSYLSDIETGKAKVSVDLLFNIVEKFQEKTGKATLLWLMTGKSDPVPWGEHPATSPLNSVLGLDGRALIAALQSVDALDRAQPHPLSPAGKARLLRNALYIYISEMERAIQARVDPSEARQIAQAACERLVLDFETPATEGPG